MKNEWAPGDYEIEVSYSLAGDASFLCTFRVEAASNDDDAGWSPGRADQPICTQLTGTIRSVSLELREVPTLQMYDSPASLQLTISNGEEALFEDTIAPDYTAHYPNGPRCGACNIASMTIDIP